MTGLERRTRIRAVSKKRAAQNRIYGKRRQAFLEANPCCAALHLDLPGVTCEGRANRLNRVEWVVGYYGFVRADALRLAPAPEPLFLYDSPGWVRDRIKEHTDPTGPLLRPTEIHLTQPNNTVRLFASVRGNAAINAKVANAWLAVEWPEIRLGPKGAVCFYGKRGTRLTLVGFVLPVALGYASHVWEQVAS